MLPATLQFLIAMIAYAINERMQRKLDYTQEEVRVLKDIPFGAKIGSSRSERNSGSWRTCQLSCEGGGKV
jgi:hypothetical protein